MEDMKEELVRLRNENTVLRGLVQCNSEWKCIYGRLDHEGKPVKSMGQCPLGFPGCSCADDLLCAHDTYQECGDNQYA